MKFILLLIAILITQLSFSQDVLPSVSEEISKENIYNFSGIESPPQYPGGIDEFYKYIGKNFKTPTLRSFKGGKLIVTFVIEKDGSITDVKVIKDIGFGTANEAVRLLKSCKKWKPGEQRDKKVRVLYTLPITLSSN